MVWYGHFAPKIKLIVTNGATMRQLRDYQTDCLEAVKTAVNKGQRHILVRMATGGGKTFTFAHLPWLLGAHRTMVVAHRDELLRQAGKTMKELGLTVGYEVAQEVADGNCQVVVASVQSLRNGRLAKFNPADFDLLIIDECFPAGTPVGNTTIDKLRVGDLVPSFDEISKTLIHKRVTHVFRKVPSGLVRISTGNKTITCTPNHPFYTGRGWVPAGTLTSSDMVLCFTHEPSNRSVQLVPETCNPNYQVEKGSIPTERTSVLLPGVRTTSKSKSQLRNNEQNKSQVCFYSNEEAQPNVRSCGKSKAEVCSTCNGMETTSAGGQRKASDSSTTTSGLCLGMAGRSSNLDRQKERSWSTDSLQSGHRGASTQNSHRSRRRQSLFIGEARSRSEERQTSYWARVDSVEILKQTSDGTFGGLCPDGLVYNIEVEDTHTYLVDGVVVHNCHHSCAPSYKRLVQHFRNASVVGFTATPYRSDKQELTDVFTDGVVFDLGLMDLIRKGYLTPIKVVKHDIQSKYEPKHVLKAYKKHASGKKSIVFCKDIAHTVEMAKTFTKSGVVAMPVYNGMGKEEREGALKKFASNEIQVLTNCNVLTEGFDEPSIQCVVLARNTSSRALYEQMIGRGTRLHENKTKLKVVQLIPVPPPRPVPVAERVQRVWRWLKPILWLAVMAGISLWLWRTCGSTQQAEEIVNRTPSLHVVSMCKVRREPSTRAKQVGLIGPLDELKKLGERRIKDQNWAKVQVGKLTGWCGCKLEMK